MFSKTERAVKRFAACTAGLESTEYAILVGLVVAATLVVIAAIGVWCLQQFQAIPLP